MFGIQREVVVCEDWIGYEWLVMRLGVSWDFGFVFLKLGYGKELMYLFSRQLLFRSYVLGIVLGCKSE